MDELEERLEKKTFEEVWVELSAIIKNEMEQSRVDFWGIGQMAFSVLLLIAGIWFVVSGIKDSRLEAREREDYEKVMKKRMQEKKEKGE